MVLKIKCYMAFGINVSFPVGELIIKNQEIVRFIENNNSEVIKDFAKNTLPLKRTQFDIEFLDEYHEESKIFSAFIKIKDSIKVGIRLNRFEKIKLKWMLKKYWVQNPENAWKILLLIVTIVIAITGFILKSP